MRRVGATQGDVFRPRGQLAREIRLAEEHPERVVELLAPHLREERRQRIDEVVAHRTQRLTVVVEGVHDPHNTAAVIRTADAFGLQTVHIIEDDVRFLSSRRVTQGAHKWVDLAVWANPSEAVRQLKTEGKRVLVAAADAEQSVHDLSGDEPLALCLGNEAEGISEELRALADGTVGIPMFGFVESLNVSVAAAISIAALRRDGGGELGDDEARVLRARFYLRAVKAGYDIAVRGLDG